MKYSLCIEMLYQDSSFYEKFAKASSDGFEYCEFWRWKDKDWEKTKNEIGKAGIKISAFSGDDDFSSSDPDDNDAYISFISRSIEKARSINCPNLVIHSDALNPADGSAKQFKKNLSAENKLINLYEVLKKCSIPASENGITLVLEPLNTIVDHKNYFLSDPDTSFDLVRSVGSPNVKLLYDVYHMQIMKGNITERLVNNIDVIGYIHVADVPGRHEPGTGEINYANVFKALKDSHYSGFAGFELSPLCDDKKAVEAIKRSMV